MQHKWHYEDSDLTGFARFAKPMEARTMPGVDTLAWTDPDDQSSASDGVSRYGAYLRRHLGLFEGCESPAEFALASWLVATGPVMAPGFVSVRADIGIELRFDPDGEGLLLAVVSVPVSLGDLRTYRLPEVNSWQLTRTWAEKESYEQPRAKLGQVAVLPTLAVQVVIDDAALPAVPAALDGSEQHRIASMRAVEAVLGELARSAEPVVDRLRRI